MTREELPVAFDFATWTRLVPESEIRRLLRVKARYYFAGGKPGVLPLDVLPKLLVELGVDEFEYILRGDRRTVIEHFNYGPTEGIPELRKVLASKMLSARDGIPIDPREGWRDVIVTTGSQQAIFAILDALIDPGDVIITQRPAYLGFVNTAAKFRSRIVTVPADEEGLVPEYVQRAFDLARRELGKPPELIYVVPDSDNPTGTTMPLKRRKEIYEIAAAEGALIVEDAAYREIQFRGERLPPIKALDSDNERVIYLRTTSKEVAVFRIGYSVMPPDVREQVVKLKGYLDLCTPTLMQRIVKAYYEKFFDENILRVREEYKKRCEAMEAAMDEYFPPGHRTEPTGGFFIWWSSDDREFDSSEFLERVAIPSGVAYVPGSAFYPPFGYSYEPELNALTELRPRKHGMRLGYSYLEPDEIYEGVRILGQKLRERESGG